MFCAEGDSLVGQIKDILERKIKASTLLIFDHVSALIKCISTHFTLSNDICHSTAGHCIAVHCIPHFEYKKFIKPCHQAWMGFILFMFRPYIRATSLKL